MNNASKQYNDGWPYYLRFASQARRKWLSYTQGSALILVYHRVASIAEDPEQLAISPALFEQHLAVFARNFTLLPLSEAVQCLRNKKRLPRKTLCLTFDDGYRDNFEIALPLLEKYQIPATFFVAGTGLDDEQVFPWEQHTPALYQHVDKETLAHAAQNPLVEIGGHTMTHPRLSGLSAEEQEKEIATNKWLLEKICGKTVGLFAYPFGQPDDFTKTSIEAVEASGFAAAVTTVSGLVSRRRNLFELPRENISTLSAMDAFSYTNHAFGDQG